MPSLAELINQADSAFAEARRANEVRYQDILAGYTERKEATLRSLQSAFTEESARLNSQYSGAMAESDRSAAARGLGGIAGDLRGGLAADQGFAERQLYGWYDPQRKLTELTQVVDRLKAIESRSDVYPDAQLYAQVLQGLGKAKALQSFAGAVGGVGSSFASLWPGGQQSYTSSRSPNQFFTPSRSTESPVNYGSLSAVGSGGSVGGFYGDASTGSVPDAFDFGRQNGLFPGGPLPDAPPDINYPYQPISSLPPDIGFDQLEMPSPSYGSQYVGADAGYDVRGRSAVPSLDAFWSW